MLGTAAYLSPEQALGEPATAAQDRYALAVVAYELLTGASRSRASCRPRRRAHTSRRRSRPRRSGAKLPPPSTRVLERGLAKDPADRPLDGYGVRRGPRAAHWSDREPTGATKRRRARSAAAREPAATPAPARGGRPPAPPSRGRAHGAFLIALAALVFVLGSGHRRDRGRRRRWRGLDPGHDAGGQAQGQAEVQAQEDAPAQTQTQAPAQTQAAPATTDKSALAVQGHNLIAQGNYPAAIDVLRRATKNCPVSTTDPCAYALYDLGHALRLAGRPAEAIPVLQQRLQNPDQRGAVQQELDLAEAAVNGGGKPGKGHGKGNDKKD